MYRFLQTNDSIRLSNPTYTTFCDGFTGSSIDQFWQVEEGLYSGNYDDVISLNSAVTPTNAVEMNYQAFYGLQLNYLVNGYLSNSDSSSLFSLTQLCPSLDGTCIYQARALYDNLCGNIQRYNDVCEDGLRRAQLKKANDKSPWTVKLYPNPASNKLNIETNRENEQLNILITDLSGRQMLSKEVKLSGFISTLDLGLLNGAYLVTVINNNHDRTIKKVLIAK